MKYLGDIAEDATIRFMWSSFDSSGASITRASDGTISVYKDGGLTQSTAGITDTEDFDGLTGVHLIVIDTSADAFYAPGSDYTVVLSGATIDGQTVNAVLAEFSIENRTTQAVNVVSIDAGAVTAAAIATGAIDADAIAADAITAAKIAAGAIDADAIAADAITAASIATDAIDADALAADALAAINAEVDTAIETYGLDHLLSASVAGADVVDNSIVAQLVSASATADWDDFDNTTDALQALRDQAELNGYTALLSIPARMEKPTSGTLDYSFRLHVKGPDGAMVDADSAPTVNTLTNIGGTDLSSRLDNATATKLSDGVYEWVYTSTSTDDAEDIEAQVFVVIDGQTRNIFASARIDSSVAVVKTTADAIEVDTQDIQGRLPTVLVGGRMDSDVGNIQAGAIDAAAIATDAVDADALAANAVSEIVDAIVLSESERQAIADVIWRRALSSIRGSTAGGVETADRRTPLGMLSMFLNEWVVSNGNLVVKDEDGEEFFTIGVGTDPGADPITSTT